MITISVIGSGNVASHLINAFRAVSVVSVVQNYARTKTVSTIPVTKDFSKLKEVDVYIIAVSDDAIEEVANKLNHCKGLVVHTSGSVPMKALSTNKSIGVFYPLQTFTKGIPVNFKTTPICIEATKKSDLKLLQSLAEAISNSVNQISSEERKQLHLAAVFVSNFNNHLYQIANTICKENNLSFELLKPLIAETLTKLEHTSPFEAQTGPAKRNDKETMKGHLQLLKNNNHKEIYSIISQSIRNTYEKKL